MSTSLQRLLPLFDSERKHAQSMVLATVLDTAGPTYTKPGAQMLIASSGEYAGLLSGGCLEGDLSERARRVFDSGNSEIVRYDMRGPEDLLFGLGSGCEGAMEILLQRLDVSHQWQPLQRLTTAWRARRPERLLMIARSTLHTVDAGMPAAQADWRAGSGIFISDGEAFGKAPPACAEALRRVAAQMPSGSGSQLLSHALPGAELLWLEQSAPPRLLLLGAGADALPVATLMTFIGWSVTVVDHRPHYARSERFPGADAVLSGGPAAVLDLVAQAQTAATAFNGAVVMSHHMSSDRAYLRALAQSTIPYIGLLGPASRRDRLLGDLEGAEVASLEPRLRAPVGLDIGAGSPEAIALSIVVEIQAMLSGNASLSPLSAKLTCPAPLRTPMR
ncbi:MAG TPA: XdhC family protein [Steroidobacteraceae bacterium]|jgi:xanthine/CO dehydrogenase XdhC/CoxF family maturation factor|nr:XdhC family protein [Steroidobacteraceae bacterium]